MKNKTIEFIKRVENSYEKIILYHHSFNDIDMEFLQNIKYKNTILVLTTKKINSLYAKGAAIKLISKEEENDLVKFYNMYNFSQKFVMIGMLDNYGSIWNFVKNGEISIEDAMDALLYRA